MSSMKTKNHRICGAKLLFSQQTLVWSQQKVCNICQQSYWKVWIVRQPSQQKVCNICQQRHWKVSNVRQRSQQKVCNICQQSHWKVSNVRQQSQRLVCIVRSVGKAFLHWSASTRECWFDIYDPGSSCLGRLISYQHVSPRQYIFVYFLGKKQLQKLTLFPTFSSGIYIKVHEGWVKQIKCYCRRCDQIYILVTGETNLGKLSVIGMIPFPAPTHALSSFSSYVNCFKRNFFNQDNRLNSIEVLELHRTMMARV